MPMWTCWAEHYLASPTSRSATGGTVAVVPEPPLIKVPPNITLQRTRGARHAACMPGRALVTDSADAAHLGRQVPD